MLTFLDILLTIDMFLVDVEGAGYKHARLSGVHKWRASKYEWFLVGDSFSFDSCTSTLSSTSGLCNDWASLNKLVGLEKDDL